jgi:hypothetical protein
LEVHVADNLGISRVVYKWWNTATSIWVDIGTIYSAPYVLNFNTSGLFSGDNHISARVFDMADNSYAGDYPPGDPPYSYIILHDIPALSVSKSGGNGIIASSPGGIYCGSTCLYGFYSGTVVTLTASPLPGFLFDHWSGACTGNGSCQLTMSSDKSVRAWFVSGGHMLYLPFVSR